MFDYLKHGQHDQVPLRQLATVPLGLVIYVLFNPFLESETVVLADFRSPELGAVHCRPSPATSRPRAPVLGQSAIHTNLSNIIPSAL